MKRTIHRVFSLLIALGLASICHAQSQPQAAVAVQRIDFVQETLPNGLQVIYAPLHQAPVVHVRVMYHVGSRDERPDRQGFAHMFEHMMFRGSAHVAPQEHMMRVDDVGGISNAFTSFDQTVYWNTVPAEHLEMVLYLEADRMSSFKVSDEIYRIERKVVAEEWRIQQNRPYGNLFEDYLKTAFTTHSYRWTPIGNMDHLLAAPVSELQEFFNTYYVPNNAVLVIAGDIDVDSAKGLVQKYFGWIPRGADVPRVAKAEPPQTEPRTARVPDHVPLTAVVVGWHVPEYRSGDNYPLAVLSGILGDGNSSRLNKLLVNGAHPMCIQALSIHEQLEDSGVLGVGGVVMLGKSADEVKQILDDAVADVVANGVSADDLAKAKTQQRVATVFGRQTAEEIASQLGDEQMFGDDADRVNRDLPKLDAVTADDVRRVARQYLQPNAATTLLVIPDPLGILTRKASTAAAAIAKDAPVVASTQVVQPRPVEFPEGYPQHPPMAQPRLSAKFEKGQEFEIDGVNVVVMTDSRLPLVNWRLAIRRGSNSDPAAKEGLASLTAQMLRRGAGNYDFQGLNQELESHGISLDVSDGGDCTNLNGSCTTEELDRAFALSRDVLLSPTFPTDEFAKLREQTIGSLMVSQEDPGNVGNMDMLRALFGGSPLGHPGTPASVANVTLDDVKKFYADCYRPNDAVLTIAGDVSPQRGEELARRLLDGWQPRELPPVDYTLPAISSGRRIILVDRPEGRGVTIRLGIRAYDIHDDEKYAGSLAGTILSSGIESRLMRYVRAEKGYVYGVRGLFSPGRHAGSFSGETDTRPEVAADTIEAIFKVLDDMRNAPVTPQELEQAKLRVIGGMVMNMQTIGQQANLRGEGILNGYPADYYDAYPGKIAAVTAEQIRNLMKKYVDPEQMVVIVVAPASEAKDQLSRLGEVEVVPMPAKRKGNSTTRPGGGR